MKRICKPDLLDEAFDRLDLVVPNRLGTALRRLRSPRARMVRIPLGIGFVVASFFWFLPVIGIEMLPIGLLLLAQDVPLLRRPAGRLTIWMLDLYEWMRLAWSRRSEIRTPIR